MTDTRRPILVTGADGALGGHAMRALIHAGHSVVALGRRSTPAFPGSARFTADITDSDAVRRTVNDVAPQVVIHLAAITGATCEASPEQAIATNVTATADLARAAAASGAERFVFASSGAVYGDAYAQPIAETHELRGESVYARTKIDAERILADIATETGMEVVALRIFNIYGDDFASSLVTRLVRSGPEAPVTLRGGDGFVRDYIHADDVARALIAASSVPLPSPVMAINVGSGQGVSNAEIIEAIGAACEPTFVAEQGAASYSVADVTRMRSILGFVGKPLAANL